MGVLSSWETLEMKARLASFCRVFSSTSRDRRLLASCSSRMVRSRVSDMVLRLLPRSASSSFPRPVYRSLKSRRATFWARWDRRRIGRMKLRAARQTMRTLISRVTAPENSRNRLEMAMLSSIAATGGSG